MRLVSTKRIGEIAKVKGGKRLPKGMEVQDDETSHPYLRVLDFGSDGVDRSNIKYISKEVFEYVKRYTITSDDVYVSIAGTIGRVGIVPEDLSGANLTENAAKITEISQEVDKQYLLHFLRSSQGQGALQNKAGGTSQPKLALFRIEEIEFPCFPILQQQHIASILSTYDDLIENNRRRMTLLEDAARQVYQEWFVRLRFPGCEHTRIVDGVPEGWERKRLGEVCYDVRDAVLPDALELDTPYIGLEHIPRRSISLTEWGSAEQVTSMKLRFREGEILFGKIRPYFHKVGIAFVDGVVSSDALVIRPTEEKLSGLVLMTVSSDAFVANTSQTMREGSKMPRADWKQMKEYPVAVPPDGLLTTFNDTICSITAQLKNLTFQNQKLRTARDLLLPKLMSGEIAV
ncbi:MAG: restriction endonuclease subunit S [Geobacteraceae bacterium]